MLKVRGINYLLQNSPFYMFSGVLDTSLKDGFQIAFYRLEISYTAWKVSKYGVISGRYFPLFSPQTGKYGLEISPYLDTFHEVIIYIIQKFGICSIIIDNKSTNDYYDQVINIILKKHRFIIIKRDGTLY